MDRSKRAIRVGHVVHPVRPLLDGADRVSGCSCTRCDRCGNLRRAVHLRVTAQRRRAVTDDRVRAGWHIHDVRAVLPHLEILSQRTTRDRDGARNGKIHPRRSSADLPQVTGDRAGGRRRRRRRRAAQPEAGSSRIRSAWPLGAPNLPVVPEKVPSDSRVMRCRQGCSAHPWRVTMSSCVGGGRGGEPLGSAKRPIRGSSLASSVATRAAARWSPRRTPSLLDRTLPHRASSERERRWSQPVDATPSCSATYSCSCPLSGSPSGSGWS